ncbi:MAG: amidohydrolase family protein [Gordonia sp. (in: high G+C Gram-positive bacteria)]
MTTLDGLIPGIVDAHVQQWNPRRTPWSATPAARLYRFVPRAGDRVFSVAVPQAEREYVLTPRTVARAYETRQYLADVAPVAGTVGVPVESVVLVESYWRPPIYTDTDAADQIVDEIAYLLGLPFGIGLAPTLGALMVRSDPRAEGFVERLDRRLALSDRIVGIQTTATRHPDPRIRDGGTDDGMVASAEYLTGLAAVAERGLAVEVFVYSHQLHEVIALAREYPETTVIVDHFGAPVGVFGPVGQRTGTTAAERADIVRLWRERMTSLAALPNVVIKLSGLALPVLGYGRRPAGNIGTRETLAHMIGPLVRHVVAHFGAERVMFGSNLPIDKPNATMDMIVGALVDVLAPWGGDQVLANVFRETARQVYRLA